MERTAQKLILLDLFGNKAIKLFCSVLLTSYKRLLFIYYLDKTEKLSSKAELLDHAFSRPKLSLLKHLNFLLTD